MKSSDEEYLDSLLNSAQSNNNPQSALNRMASKTSRSDSGEPQSGESEDLSALIDNSSGNKEIKEVGELLDRFDKDEIIDDKLASLLDDIQKPTSSDIPKYTVGDEPTAHDARDAEEIALDEAIANAEKTDAELKNGGTISNTDAAPVSSEEVSNTEEAPENNESGSASDSVAQSLENIDIPLMPEPIPIIDESELGDALAEMAPEIDLPEESNIITEKESDADQTPEEILTDLLDDMPGGNLMDSQNNQESSLSDIIDRERNAEAAQNAGNGIDELSLDNMMDALIEQEAPASQEVPSTEPAPEPVAEPAVEEPKPDPIAEAVADMPVIEPDAADALAEALAATAPESDAAVTDTSEAEALLDALADAVSETPAGEAEAPAVEETAAENTTVTEDGIPELDTLLNLLPEDENAADNAASAEDAAAPEQASEAEQGGDEAQPESMEAQLDAGNDSGEINVTATELGFIEEDYSARAPVGLDQISEDDINLNDLEANLDELLGGMNETYETTEGEVAKILGDEPKEINADEIMQDSGDISMPDLDALMNSLANDEVESIEDTAHLDKELGQPDGELPKEDILDALTETGFDDIGNDEIALDAISALPEMATSENVDMGDIPEAGGGKKRKEGLLVRLLKALTAEDEEEEDVGTEGLAGLTDENQQVLSELGDVGEKPKKKPKKEKKKKEKAAKPPKPKKEKPPKEKKEKPKKEKPPKEPGVPEKAIAPKKIAVSGIFAASLGILVCIPAIVLPERIASERARTAYAQQEYATTYTLLYGKEMTADQSAVYEQSRVLAWSQRYLTGYENYMAMNMEVEALDMLLMSKRNKESLMEEATKFKVENQVRSVYDSIESLLSENYGLSEEDVVEINSIKKERDYTIRIMEIVGKLEP